MPIMMIMEWDGVTPEQYDQVKQLVNWESDVPSGAMIHGTAFSEQGARITDIWESAEAFETFVNTRLMPGVQQVGIQGEPRVEIYPVHDLFTPAFKPA